MSGGTFAGVTVANAHLSGAMFFFVLSIWWLQKWGEKGRWMIFFIEFDNKKTRKILYTTIYTSNKNRKKNNS